MRGWALQPGGTESGSEGLTIKLMVYSSYSQVFNVPPLVLSLCGEIYVEYIDGPAQLRSTPNRSRLKFQQSQGYVFDHVFKILREYRFYEPIEGHHRVTPTRSSIFSFGDSLMRRMGAWGGLQKFHAMT